MTIGDWIGIGVAAWLVVAVLVGLAVGHLVAVRDRQNPAPHDARAGKPERHNVEPTGLT